MKWSYKDSFHKKTAKKKAKMQWHDWHAWYPVFQDGWVYWLCGLQRKYVDNDHMFMSYYLYREKEKE